MELAYCETGHRKGAGQCRPFNRGKHCVKWKFLTLKQVTFLIDYTLLSYIGGEISMNSETQPNQEIVYTIKALSISSRPPRTHITCNGYMQNTIVFCNTIDQKFVYFFFRRRLKHVASGLIYYF